MPLEKFRVLIIDDEPCISDTLAEIVSLSGYESLAAHSGLEAIEAAKKFQPHIVVSDVTMPEPDGVQLAKHFAVSPGRCRVLLMSGRSDGTQIATNLMNEGYPVRFFPKPVPPQTILAFLAECRDGKRATALAGSEASHFH